MRYVSSIFVLLITTIMLTAQNTDSDIPLLFTYTTNTDYRTNANANWDFYLIDWHTKETLYVMDTEDRDCPVRLSPNNQYLLYEQSTPNANQYNFEFGILNLDTDTQIPLPYYVWGASWSPDSQQLAYHDNSQNRDFIQTLRIYDVSDNTHQTIATADAFLSLLWLEDGLYFATDQNHSVILSVWDGEQVTQLLQTRAFDTNLFIKYSLSHDAQYGVISVLKDGERTNYISHVATNETIELDLAPTGYAPIWQPNGNKLVAFTTQGQLYVVDVDTSEYQLLTELDGFPNSLQWSPNGRYISYNQRIQDQGKSLHVIDTITQDEIVSYTLPSQWGGEMSWVSNTEFAFVGTQPNSDILDLYSYDIITQGVSQLTDTPELNEEIRCSVG